MALETEKILAGYFSGTALELVITHGALVACLASRIGENLNLQKDEAAFLKEAAMLHDIGICRVYAPDICMHGNAPYITHGVIGRKILEDEGLPRHALVSERHIGVGLTLQDIVERNLPLPKRDMTPQNIPEEIICFADLFYSKNPKKLKCMKNISEIRDALAIYGKNKVAVFERWLDHYGKKLFTADGRVKQW